MANAQLRRHSASRIFALITLLLFFTYDASGNTTFTGGNTYAYNSWLRLVSMNGGQVTLAYNGLGQLVSKTVRGVTRQYLIDDLSPTGYPQVVADVVNGQIRRIYTYGLERISELQMVNNAPTASFYQYDGRGTVRMLTNSAGAVTDSYEYDAYGNLFTKQGSTPNNYLYRGEQFDSDLGLYYLRARYYNPNTGRFMSRDPEDGDQTDPKTLHKYLYTGGDPVNGWDPTGRAVAVAYSWLTGWDVAMTFIKAVAVSGTIDCLLEFSLSKFTGAIEAALDGGSISQVGPCVWIFINLQKALPQPVAPAQPVAGTKLSPWTPQCDELGAAVQAAKALANSLGKCSAGMSPWQLQVRYDAWVGLGVARAQFNMVCWHGGDEGHQEADANAWLAAGNCAMLKAAF
jgi:RHS repeat-associated protein